jgi:hypothetical protein
MVFSQVFNVALVMIGNICKGEIHSVDEVLFELDFSQVFDVLAVNDLLALTAEISLCCP